MKVLGHLLQQLARSYTGPGRGSIDAESEITVPPVVQPVSMLPMPLRYQGGFSNTVPEDLAICSGFSATVPSGAGEFIQELVRFTKGLWYVYAEVTAVATGASPGAINTLASIYLRDPAGGINPLLSVPKAGAEFGRHARWEWIFQFSDDLPDNWTLIGTGQDPLGVAVTNRVSWRFYVARLL